MMGAFALSVAATFAIVADPAAAAGSLPSGTTPVSVKAGAVTKNVNAKLLLGEILTVQATHGADPAAVTLYRDGQPYRTVNTDPTSTTTNGDAVFSGLTTGTYAVCAVPLGPLGSLSPTTGDAAGCYAVAARTLAPIVVPFDGVHVPANAAAVDPAKTPRIDVPLSSGAAISGRVRGADGAGVAGVTVNALNRLTGQLFTTTTSSTGDYTVRHLSGSTSGSTTLGYAVCFDPHGSSQLSPLAPICYHNVLWNGGQAALPAVTKVLTTPRHLTGGINQALQVGGVIAGTTVNATGQPVSANVQIFSGQGRRIAFVTSGSNGSFQVPGLSPNTNYRVCASGELDIGECWKNIPWTTSTLPAGTTPVAVKAGAMTSGILLALASQPAQPFGTISGHILDLDTGQPLVNAKVWVFDSTGSQQSLGGTDSSGAYSLQLPPSASGYFICATGWGAASPTGLSTAGWAPRCHGGAAWVGVGPPPRASRAVPVANGATVSGIDIKLPTGGVITGGGAGAGVGPNGSGVNEPVEIEAFTASGKAVTSTFAQRDGTYQLTGLQTGKYIVCFDGSGSGVLSQCYKRIPWDPVP